MAEHCFAVPGTAWLAVRKSKLCQGTAEQCRGPLVGQWGRASCDRALLRSAGNRLKGSGGKASRGIALLRSAASRLLGSGEEAS